MPTTPNLAEVARRELAHFLEATREEVASLNNECGCPREGGLQHFMYTDSFEEKVNTLCTRSHSAGSAVHDTIHNEWFPPSPEQRVTFLASYARCRLEILLKELELHDLRNEAQKVCEAASA